MRQFIYVCILSIILAMSPSARAGTKEELVRLQSDVLAMQNQLRMMEKAFTDQSDGLKSLIVQLNDQVGRSNQLLSKISTSLDTQSLGDKSSNQAVLQELRNLNVKMDDTATRLSALSQQLADLKVQAKPIESGAIQGSGSAGSPDMYNQAFNDLVQGNLDLAIDEFSAFIKNNPGSDKADDAQYNIGEAYYNSNKFPQAVAAFTRVLNDYPNGDKVASAYFKRGKAELAMKERENAVEDFKSVVEKFPSASEAGLARMELENLGVDLKPAKKPTTRRR